MSAETISKNIEMSGFKLDGKNIKVGGTYLTNKGKIRKPYKNKLVKVGNKLYNVKNTKVYAFNGSQIDKSDLKYNDNVSLKNSFLLDTLAKKSGLKGDVRVIIKRNGVIQKQFDFNFDKLRDIDEEANDGKSPYKIYNKNLGENTRVVIIFAKNKKVPQSVYEQKYLDAENAHCFFTDIVNYYSKRMEIQESIGKTTKKSNAVINKVLGKGKKEGLIQKYSAGVPHSVLTDLCKELHIGVEIYLPFQKEAIYNFKPPTNSFYGKTFRYLNTRLDHLENAENFTHEDIYYKSFDPTPVTYDRLQEIVADKLANNEFVAYKRGYYNGYSSAKTATEWFVIEDEKQEVFNKFTEDTGLKHCCYNAKQYPLLDEFVSHGLHYNSTVDFQDTDELDTILDNCISTQNIIQHIDITKAYSQFHRSKYYEGFMGKITDFRKHTGKAKQVGFYLVSKLDFKNCDKKFLELNEKLNWFTTGNIYTYAELKALEDMGVKYETSSACFGTDFDFRFSDEMLYGKAEYIAGDEKRYIPYYSVYTGIMASDNSTTSYYMKGKHEYYGKYTEHDIYYNDASDDTRITFNNKSNWTRKHITAQITAYQRLIILEQLMKMELKRIIRVCVDGIYYYNHSFKIDSCFSKKEKMTFQNSPASSYISNLLQEPTGKKQLLDKLSNLAEERDYYHRELWLGPGGTGKTFQNCGDMGFIHPVYVPHSWKLASTQKEGKTQVHHSLRTDNKITNWTKKFNVYLIDECSMLTEADKQFFFKNIPGRMIFMGDLKGQLKPIVKTENKERWKHELASKDYFRRVKQMGEQGFNYITTLTFVWRFKCELLRTFANEIRNHIDNDTWDASLLACCKETTMEEMNYNHKTDIILGPRHSKLNKYNEKFSHLKKYKVLENANGYYNGDIVYEKPNVENELRHGYTVHSVQGETFDGTIFIDTEHIHIRNPKEDLRMLYTAISRARRLEQIVLVK